MVSLPSPPVTVSSPPPASMVSSPPPPSMVSASSEGLEPAGVATTLGETSVGVMVSLASVPMKVANAALHMSKVPPYAEPSRLTLLRAPLVALPPNWEFVVLCQTIVLGSQGTQTVTGAALRGTGKPPPVKIVFAARRYGSFCGRWQGSRPHTKVGISHVDVGIADRKLLLPHGLPARVRLSAGALHLPAGPLAAPRY